MIKNKIYKPDNLTSDSIIQIIEIYFSGRYKTMRQTDTKIRIKRLYKFKSNGWEVIYKQMDFKDSGYFNIYDDNISFSFDLTKLIVFWTLISIIGFFVLWQLSHLSLVISFALIFIPLIFVWINGLYGLKQFTKFELDTISKRLNDSSTV
ncbi:hypothetical protein [Carboxylicivirga caseinilyticus]|uniref:hypothetical protein n=1 Tax=Carboxylicivirga caseinilyticus TaxID=3417572 RepID=UPI003D333782|nr:hypothetical protein [Marinilabiliaceae bacterium A049]